MTIEKDIKQPKFRNEHQKAAINLIYTYNWTNEKMKKILDHFGITSQQFNILRILRGAHAPLSTLQIRERMLDKMSDTSRIVDRIIIKGLAKKTTCRSDRRLVDVIITSRGKKLLEKLDQCDQAMDAVLKNLSTIEAKALNELLDKIRNGS
jgi:DNA-binding MarR family transcriptional regulator